MIEVRVREVTGDSLTWHTSYDLALKASTSGQHTYRSGRSGRLSKAVPTAVKGRAKPGDFAGWPNEDIIERLIAEKAKR